MQPENIAILFPTAMEAAPFIEKNNGALSVHVCGVGLVECAASTARIIGELHPSFLLLAGIAGAYPSAEMDISSASSQKTGNKKLQKGDTVLVVRENSADLGTMSSGIFKPFPKSYDCHSPLPDIFPKVVSNSVNTASTSYINELFRNAAIENMEGAAFFAICNALGVACAELRVVSNIVGEPHKEWITLRATEILADSIDKFLVHNS